MKRLSLILGAFLGLMVPISASAAHRAEEKPIITFKTNIYETYGSSNSFHITLGTTEETYFDIDYGYGTEELLVAPSSFDEDSQSITGTSISMSVSPAGLVKIYGDASLLDYLDCEGCYIDWIDLGNCTNLEILNLQHNELKWLDLSKYTKLKAIYLSDNTFSREAPLVVGDNHPDLAILEVDIVDWISPDFDISSYHNLLVFDAYANKTLTKIDPTGCPYLLRLSLDSTGVTSLDVSKNPYLQILNVEDSGISSLDLSNNPELTQLYITHVSPNLHPESRFTDIDLSKNTKLWYLAAGGNRLSKIDVSPCPGLQHLRLEQNLLSEIDLSNNPDLYLVDLRNNNFTFATLPLPEAGWGEYYYAQNPMPVDRQIKVGSTLDFSSRVLRDGTVTEGLLYSYNRSSGEDSAMPDDYYSYSDGKITFLKETGADSVFVVFNNSAFTESALTTSRFKVCSDAEYGKASPLVTIGTTLASGKPFEMGVGIKGAKVSDPVKFMVDLGDGKPVEFEATTSEIPLAPNVASTVKGDGDIIIYIPQDAVLYALSLDDMPLYSLDVTQASDLRMLSASGTGITKIDLSLNNNLRSLNLSGNRFTSIDLEGANGTLGKNFLRNIDLSNNRLTNVVLNDTRAIDYLNLSHNRLSEFDYKEFEYIKEFDISYNSISTINLSYFTSAEVVNVSNNALSEIYLPETNVFNSFSIENNCFTLENLPLIDGCNYTYAPQAALTIPEMGPSVDLTAQNRVVDGKGTVFTWRMAADNSLVSASKIDCDGGLTRFLDPDLGTVYCEMTNPAFPAFEGANIFRTTNVTAAPMPTRCIASFTTLCDDENVGLSLAAARDNTTLFIDWEGKGVTADPYQLTTSYRLFEAKTQKDAKVKVLTYSEADTITVFSMTGATLADADFYDMDSVATLTVANASIDKIRLPRNLRFLEELNLDGNRFTNGSLDFAALENLRVLYLSHNNFDHLDLSRNPRLIVVGAAANKLSSVKLDNPEMWMLDLTGNDLAELDLSGVPNMQQLGLSRNNLSEIDLDCLDGLRVVTLDQNRFTFATLPRPRDSYFLYNYINQAALTPAVFDHRCDLSAQAQVDGVPTDFRWFVGVPEFDENGTLTGEELFEGEEYTVEDGITTFLISYDNIMCVMTNDVFPNLYLYTGLLSTEDGVEAVETSPMSVTLNGNEIVLNAPDLPDGAPVSLYLADGRLVAGATVDNGTAIIAGAPRGHVILVAGGSSFKLLVR